MLFGIRWEVLVLDLLMLLSAMSYIASFTKIVALKTGAEIAVVTLVNTVIFGSCIWFYWHLAWLLLPGAGS